VLARGRLLEKKVRTMTATSITWQGDVQLDGRLRIRLGTHTIEQRVAPGLLRLRINRPRGHGLLVLETRPDRYSVWAREDSVRLP
jgi:hypothetical protein